MDIFETTRIKLSNQGLRIDRYDLNRPWGGFFVLDENQAQVFADIYFEGLDVAPLRIAGKLSPKILLVKPEARLSCYVVSGRQNVEGSYCELDEKF